VTRILVRARAGRAFFCAETTDGRAFARVSPPPLCAQAVPAVKPNTIKPAATMVNATVRCTVILTLKDLSSSPRPTLAYRGARVNVRTVLAERPPSPRTATMADAPFSDPLAWRTIKAPSLEELELLAGEAFRRLPMKFRSLCEGLVIRVEDFPTDEVLDGLGAQTEFDLLGLFQGVGLPFRSESAPAQMPNMIWLYRRPMLDYWAEHDESLGAIITHVLVHEIGHHFGLSDDDMEALEEAAE
jgi:predicted Zn-dependent protease with MMP-like domain